MIGGFQQGGNAFQTDYQQSVLTTAGPSIILALPSTLVTQLSDFYVSIAYYDIYGEPLIPSAVAWRLWDDTNKVDIFSWTTVGTLSESDIVNIPPAGHIITNPDHLVEQRKLIFRVTSFNNTQRYDTFVYNALAVTGGVSSFPIQKPGSLVTLPEPGPNLLTLMPTVPRNQISELSDYYVTIAYLDIYGMPYAPVTVYWKLWDDTNKVVLVDWTSIGNLDIANLIDIPASAHAITNTDHMIEARQIDFLVIASGGAQRYDYVTYNVIAVPDIP